MSLSSVVPKLDLAFQQLTEAFAGAINALKNVADIYYRDVAEPEQVVDYILEQPNHTWMGVTIYPDEAWRYRTKSDWMWWRE